MEAMKSEHLPCSRLLVPVLLSSLLLVACGGGEGGSESDSVVATAAESDTVAALATTSSSDAATSADAGSGDAAGDALPEGNAVAPLATDTTGVLGYDGASALEAGTTPRETAQAVRAGTRNVMKQPFAQNSVWNMPIGTGAAYVHARLSTRPRNDEWAPMPAAERDHIVLRPTAPVTSIYRSNAGWSGSSRCSRSNDTVLARVPIPSDYVVASARTNDSRPSCCPTGAPSSARNRWRAARPAASPPAGRPSRRPTSTATALPARTAARACPRSAAPCAWARCVRAARARSTR